MANEITVSASVTILKDKFEYRNFPTTFQLDLTAKNGPSPGSFEVSTEGTDVDLSNLDSYGIAVFKNYDPDNYVSVGVWDGSTFFPLFELPPLTGWPYMIARDLGEEYGTGTGTTGAAINTLRLKANTANCQVSVEAFER